MPLAELERFFIDVDDVEPGRLDEPGRFTGGFVLAPDVSNSTFDTLVVVISNSS